jgi:hypothetical protein
MIRKNVAEILHHHVTFELEAIDRMYLNAYVPSLQTGGGVVYFLKTQLGVRVPSTVMVAPMTERFVNAIEGFVAREGIDLVTFEKGQRKDDVAQHREFRDHVAQLQTREPDTFSAGSMTYDLRRTTSTSSTATSARCSSSSAPTFRTRRSSV